MGSFEYLEEWNYSIADEVVTEILFLTTYGRAIIKCFMVKIFLQCQLKAFPKYDNVKEQICKGSAGSRSCMGLGSKQQFLSASG